VSSYRLIAVINTACGRRHARLLEAFGRERPVIS
jgi:hypothetical protein